MFLEKADTWIITTIFDPISQKVQARTGHTCYYIAWWCVGLSILISMIDISRYLRFYLENGGVPPEAALGFWGVVGPYPFFLALLVVDLYKWQKLSEREQWQSSALPVTRTPTYIIMRLVMVATCVFAIVMAVIRIPLGQQTLLSAFLGHADFVILTIGEYFAACTPLPPWAFRRQENEAQAGRNAPVVNRNAA